MTRARTSKYGSKSNSGSSSSASTSASNSGLDNSLSALFDTFLERAIAQAQSEQQGSSNTNTASIDVTKIASISFDKGLDILVEDCGLELEDVRSLVLLWKLGSTKPGKLLRTEFINGCKTHNISSMSDITEQLLPTLDPNFLVGEEFKNFYKFVFKFNLEEPLRVHNREMFTELMKLIIGERLEEGVFVDKFVAFLFETRKDNELYTFDQWKSFLDFSLMYKNIDNLIENYDEEENSAWPLLLDDFVRYLEDKSKEG